MNRTQRINQIRQERENGGLQQVVQMQGLGQMQTVRKTTYTRPELVQRGPLATNTNRNKRGGMVNNNQTRLTSVAPVAIEDGAAASRRAGATRAAFLPRVAKLAANSSINNNNNNNISHVIKGNNREKSPARKVPKSSPIVCDSASSMVSLEPGQQLKQLVTTTQMTSIACGNSCSLSSSSSNCICNSNSNSSLELHKIKLAQAFRLPDEQNKSFVYLCKPVKQVQELLTVQPLLNHSNDNISQLGVANNEESDSISCSSTLSSQRQQLPPADRSLRADRAHSARAQLEAAWAGEPLRQPVVQRQLEMDLVCHNIPTLQREIRLLQQLGEKLEATLRANTQNTSTAKIQTEPHLDSSSVFYTPRSTLTLVHAALPIVRWGCRRVEHSTVTAQRVRIIAAVCCIGIIEEFRIETKTLTELKTADESQCFYLPMSDDGALQLTSFRKLRENPNVLLQMLRPLTPARPFNLLEQDAMFFNSLLTQADPMPFTATESVLPRESGGTALCNLSAPSTPSLPYSRLTVRGTSMKEAHMQWSASDVERLLFPSMSECRQALEAPPTLSTSSADTSSRVVSKLPHTKNRNISCCKRPKMKPIANPSFKLQHRCKPRVVTPLKPQTVELEPQMQTHLLKRVLVGIVQVALFLVLIMAFTYPDVRC